MRYTNFLVTSLEFSMYGIVISADRCRFPICISLTTFSFLIAVARVSKTMLNKRVKNGHAYFVPDLRGNAFSFSTLSMMLAVCFSYMDFIVLK